MLQPLSYWGTGYELGCIRDSYVVLVLFTARVSDSVYIILSCYTLFGLLQMQWDLQATILHLFPRSFPCQEPINTWLHIGSCKCLSPNSSHLMFHPPSSITTPDLPEHDCFRQYVTLLPRFYQFTNAVKLKVVILCLACHVIQRVYALFLFLFCFTATICSPVLNISGFVLAKYPCVLLIQNAVTVADGFLRHQSLPGITCTVL